MEMDMDMREYRDLVIDELGLKELPSSTSSEIARYRTRNPASGTDRGTLPEYTQYRDEGCDISPTCLRCPLPQCRYDDPGWLRRETKSRRDREVLLIHQAEGLGPTDLARRFGLSRRTIHRILREHRGAGTT